MAQPASPDASAAAGSASQNDHSKPQREQRGV